MAPAGSPIHIALWLIFLIVLVYIFIVGVVAFPHAKYMHVPFISRQAWRYADKGQRCEAKAEHRTSAS